MSILEFDDGIGGRLRGTLHAPGATPGDVLTVGATRGAISPAPGGGSQPDYAFYTGSGVVIADGDIDSLTLDTLFFGNPLLDISAPADPAFAAPGTYFVLLVASSTAQLTAGGFAYLVGNIGAFGGGDSLPPSAEAQRTDLGWSVSAVTVAQAGDLVTAAVRNFDGAASRTFSLTAHVIQLS